jgi:hypothetical protein
VQRGPSWVSWLPVFNVSVVTNQLARDTKRRWTHNVYITKLVQPKVINCVGRGHKVTFAELLVGLRGGDVELVKDPFLDETLVASGLFVTRGRESQEIYNLVFISKTGKTNFGCGFRFECLVKFQHGELGRVEYLVAKLAVTFHAQDFEVDITPWDHISNGTEQVINKKKETSITSATVSAECETQCIRTALRDTLREILLLTQLGFFDLLRVEVTFV